MSDLHKALSRHPVVKFLTLPHIFYFATLWLIALLVIGTIAQRDMGLYIAQNKYFSSMLIWVGPIPIPGGRLTMAAITINLLGKLLFASKWSRKSAGVIVAHAGVLLLFVGGFITAIISYEGSMFLPEGEKSSYFSDYHLRELAVVNTTHPEYNDVTAFHGSLIDEGSVIKDEAFPGTIEVVAYLTNCRPVRRGNPAPAEYRGVGQRFELEELRSYTEHGRNTAGMVLRLSGLSEAENGIYLLFDTMPVDQTFTINGQSYKMLLRNKRYLLPFTIELTDFEKQVHPGTQMPRSFSSDIFLIENEFKRRVKIEMNAPLRHKGYTFYQSSFVQDGINEASVFAVVDNPGQLFPYVSCIVACLGLLLHLALQLPRLVDRRTE